VVWEPGPILNTAAGFQDFTARLDRVCQAHAIELVLIGHEPTGVYHEAWGRALQARYRAHLANQASPRVVYQFVNPYQVKSNRQQAHYLRRKTDQLDLAAIGDLLARGLGAPAFLPNAAQLAVREQVNRVRGLVKLQRRHTNAVLSTFDQLLPGAFLDPAAFRRAHPKLAVPTPLATRPLERRLVQVLIEHCPNPYTIRRLGQRGLIDLFHAHAARCGPATARRILDVVRRALLPPEDIAEVLTATLQANFRLFQATAAESDVAAARLAELLPATPARHLLAISGASPTLVGRYVAGVGDVHRFLYAQQVWSLAGFDPQMFITGDVVVFGPLSKHGDPFLRDTLYLLGYSLAMHCPHFTRTFLDAIDRGKSEVEATIHTARRVNRVFFHLLTHDEPFRPPPEEDAAFEARTRRRLQDYLQAKRRRGRKRTRPQAAPPTQETPMTI
jgi:transposase